MVVLRIEEARLNFKMLGPLDRETSKILLLSHRQSHDTSINYLETKTSSFRDDKDWFFHHLKPPLDKVKFDVSSEGLKKSPTKARFVYIRVKFEDILGSLKAIYIYISGNSRIRVRSCIIMLQLHPT